MPVTPVYTYARYSGTWTLSQVSDAVASNTWPLSPPFFGTLYAWGTNSAGELGIGNTTLYSSPKQVGSVSTWLQISAGQYSSAGNMTFAIKKDSTLWAWGRNTYGQLGLGNRTYYSSPKQVGALNTWSQISAGGSIAFGIQNNGTLWFWGAGADSNGPSGLNTRTNYSSPVQVGTLTNWSYVCAGDGGTVGAVKTDGTLWMWGRNDRGQCGLGNISKYSSPIQVGSLTNWSILSTAQISSMGLKTDGTIWTWGANQNGQLGFNNSTQYSSPKQVGALTNWSQISMSTAAFAINTSGALWAWGRNLYGQLGLGNTTYYSSPKQVGSLTNWKSIGQTTATTISLKTDGTLWGWGYNASYGPLGLGNTTNYSSPKQVGALTTWLYFSAGRYYTAAIHN